MDAERDMIDQLERLLDDGQVFLAQDLAREGGVRARVAGRLLEIARTQLVLEHLCAAIRPAQTAPITANLPPARRPNKAASTSPESSPARRP